MFRTDPFPTPFPFLQISRLKICLLIELIFGFESSRRTTSGSRCERHKLATLFEYFSALLPLEKYGRRFRRVSPARNFRDTNESPGFPAEAAESFFNVNGSFLSTAWGYFSHKTFSLF